MPGRPWPRPAVVRKMDGNASVRDPDRTAWRSGVAAAPPARPAGFRHGVLHRHFDLFVISIVSTLLKTQWHLGTSQLALLNAVMLGAAFLGAIVFGRLADKIGRTRVYWMSAALMVIAAAGSALAPSLAVLIAFRFLLGFGVGGDYPVSAVLMSEYSGRGNRGRMVGLVFSAQAVGLIVGPVVALALLGGGVGPALTWRVLLGLGAIPAAAAVWLRRKMPEPPRYQSQAASTTQTSTPAPAPAAAGLRA